MHDGNHLGLWQQDAVRIAQRHRRVHEVLAGDDHALGGHPRLLADAERAPCVRAALRVAALDVKDGHVRPHGADVHQAVDLFDVRIRAQDVAAEERPRRQVRHVPRRGPERHRDREVGVVVDLDRPRDPLLGGAPVAVAKPFGNVAHPGGGDTAHAAGADELVEQGVRDGSDELEVLAALPDQLVSGGKWDERLERGAEGYGRTVGDESIDGLGHRHDLRQRANVSM